MPPLGRRWALGDVAVVCGSYDLAQGLVNRFVVILRLRDGLVLRVRKWGWDGLWTATVEEDRGKESESPTPR